MRKILHATHTFKFITAIKPKLIDNEKNTPKINDLKSLTRIYFCSDLCYY